MGASTNRPCPGCRSSSSRSAGLVNEFEVAACDNCGTLFTARLPVEDEEKDYGSFYGEGRDVAVPDFVLGRLEETATSLSRYRSDLNRWLDIGCGTGTLLRAAVNVGWDALGTEVAPAAVEAVRAEGLDAVLGTTAELGLPAASFDVVSMIEVIEHVAEPDRLLADAARLLRPGGVLYLTTPHGRSLSARMLGAGWSAVTPPDHLQLFSIAGLSAALDRNDLEVHSVATHGINPPELTTGLRRSRGGGGRSGGTQANYRLNESLSTRPTGRAVKRLANSVLSSARLGDTLKVIAERG
jgi:SAM-dependent methyltransferase